MALITRQRSYSLNSLGYSSLREQQQNKKERINRQTLTKLNYLKKTYELPFLSQPKRNPSTEDEQPQDLPLSPHAHLKPDYATKCKKVCEDLCFNLYAFDKIFKDNHRKKTYLSKFYGWDKEFQEIFFVKGKEQLRLDITPALLTGKLNLGAKTSASSNTLNKLRLFLSQLEGKNERQQNFQSTLMKGRLTNQLSKLDGSIIGIVRDRSRKDLRGYVDQIGRTQELMLNIKVRSKNRLENLAKIEQETGKVNVNQFYGKEEATIDSIEKYFTRIRLKRQQ